MEKIVEDFVQLTLSEGLERALQQELGVSLQPRKGIFADGQPKDGEVVEDDDDEEEEVEEEPPRDYSIASLVIRSLTLTNIPNVNWNGKNNILARIKFGSWTHETATIWGAGSSTPPFQFDVVIPVKYEEEESNPKLVFSVEVFNKSLAKKDQLIGLGSVPLTAVTMSSYEEPDLKKGELPISVVEFPTEPLVVRLHTDRGLMEERPRGIATLDVSYQRVMPRVVKEEVIEVDDPEDMALDAKVLAKLGIVAKPRARLTIINGVATPASTKGVSFADPGASEKTKTTAPSGSLTVNSAKELPKITITRSMSNQVMSTKTVDVVDDDFDISNEMKICRVADSALDTAAIARRRDVKDVHRVVDEAFAMAMRLECAVVSLTHKEVILLLDSLGCQLNPASLMPKSSARPSRLANFADLSGRTTTTSAAETLIDLPILDTAALASALNKFISDRLIIPLIENSKNYLVTSQKAEIAKNNIRTLIEGSWMKARLLLLVATSRSDPGSGRPMQWHNKWVRRLTKLLHFPPERFIACTGKELLRATDDSYSSVYLIESAVMKARFAVYIHTLRLIEMWWDRGFRPSDHHHNPMGLSFSIAFIKPTNNDPKPIDSWHGLLERWAPKDSVRKRSSRKAFTSTLDSVSSWSSVAPDMSIFIATPQKLVSSWTPLNASLGWGLAMDMMILIASVVGGTTGSLVEYLSDECMNSEVCRWVSFRNQMCDAKAEMTYSKIAKVLYAIDGWAAIVRKDAVGEISVFIPVSCLLLTTPPSTQSSSSDHPLLSVVHPTHVQVGCRVRLSDTATLINAYNQYQWWDRPSREVMYSISELTGEITSIKELFLASRVEVKIVVGADDVIVDHVPLAAMYFEEPLALNSTGASGKAKAKSNKGSNRSLTQPASKEVLLVGTSLQRGDPSLSQSIEDSGSDLVRSSSAIDSDTPNDSDADGRGKSKVRRQSARARVPHSHGDDSAKSSVASSVQKYGRKAHGHHHRHHHGHHHGHFKKHHKHKVASAGALIVWDDSQPTSDQKESDQAEEGKNDHSSDESSSSQGGSGDESVFRPMARSSLFRSGSSSSSRRKISSETLDLGEGDSRPSSPESGQLRASMPSHTRDDAVEQGIVVSLPSSPVTHSSTPSKKKNKKKASSVAFADVDMQPVVNGAAATAVGDGGGGGAGSNSQHQDFPEVNTPVVAPNGLPRSSIRRPHSASIARKDVGGKDFYTSRSNASSMPQLVLDPVMQSSMMTAPATAPKEMLGVVGNGFGFTT